MCVCIDRVRLKHLTKKSPITTLLRLQQYPVNNTYNNSSGIQNGVQLYSNKKVRFFNTSRFWVAGFQISNVLNFGGVLQRAP